MLYLKGRKKLLMGCSMSEDIHKLLESQAKIIRDYQKEIERLKGLVEYYKNESCTDSLTNLKNRRAIDDLHGVDVVVLGDIDHFKKINDTYGHDCGDQVLVEISNVLKNCTRNTDHVFRWGGEEFVIFLQGCKVDDGFNKALLWKNKIEELKDKFGFDITMSFGVSDLTNKTMQEAIKEADEAMYKSKETGRNRVTIYQLKRK